MEKQKSVAWFEEWFDSAYYHLLYQHRDDVEAGFFISNILRHLALPEGSSILDLACGKGRHAVSLNQAGYEVTGLDLSPANIRAAQSLENSTLSFYIHDMRHPFRINDFNCVMNLFTSFGYFENERDNARAVSSLSSALQPGGHLIIDFMNTRRAELSIVPFETKNAGKVSFEIRRRIENSFFIKDIRILDEGKTFNFHEKVQALVLADFEKLLADAGLKILHLFGNYALESFDANTSDRLIIHAVKISD